MQDEKIISDITEKIAACKFQNEIQVNFFYVNFT